MMLSSAQNILSRKKFSRRKSYDIYKKVLELRQNEYSYSEIKKETGIAKSTIQNWLTHAGLVMSLNHMQIQAKNRSKNHIIATEASKITRKRRKDKVIQAFIQKNRKFFDNPFFVGGIMLYEAEGSKGTDCKFSNSDFRVISVFINFIEKYFLLKREVDMNFDLYIHVSRARDLGRIKRFWSNKINISVEKLRVYWKRNKVVGRKENMNYVGQMLVRITGQRIFGSKLLAISDIILTRYLR